MLHPDLHEVILVLEELSINDPIVSTLVRRAGDIQWVEDPNHTAGVALSPEGKIIFQFSPSFWKSLENSYRRAFVVAHEMMHIILNHMERITQFATKHEKSGVSEEDLLTLYNYAIDLVVNESLLESGFDKERLGPMIGEMVFWETLLPVVQEMIASGVAQSRISESTGQRAYEMFQRSGKDSEYYAWWLLKLVSPEDPTRELRRRGGKPIETMADLKDFIQNNPELVAEVIAEAIGREILEGNTELEAELVGGPGQGKRLIDADGGVGRTILPDKKKLRSLVKTDFGTEMTKAVNSAMNYPTVTTFAREERRYHTLADKFRLPALISRVITVNFQIYIDVSGSVARYTQQFINSSLSVIETVTEQKMEVEVGNVDYFIFANQVRNITSEMQSGSPVKLDVGGGTSFTAIWDTFEEIGDLDAFVYVITDGYGDGMGLITTDKWYWLIYAPEIYGKSFNEVIARVQPFLPANARVFPFNISPE